MFDPARFQIEFITAAIQWTLATVAEDQMRQVVRGLP
jgi:hypothetical protein